MEIETKVHIMSEEICCSRCDDGPFEWEEGIEKPEDWLCAPCASGFRPKIDA